MVDVRVGIGFQLKTSNRSRVAFFFFAFLLGSLNLSAPLWAASAQKLFEQGLFTETGERNPEKALDYFRQAAQEAGPRNPGLLADARLHMGRCLSKLGKTDEALGIYLVITKNPAGVSADTLQTAQTESDRIQADMKRAADQAALEEAAHRNVATILVPEFRDNGVSLLFGPTFVRGSGVFAARGDVSMRLRIFGRQSRPVFLEVGALTPGENPAMASGEFKSSFFPGATDEAELHMGYQIHAALVRDLPHGHQDAIIPEVGVGAAYTTSRVNVMTSSTDNFTGLPTLTTQETHFRVWSPYLRAGVRLFANHPVSVLLGLSYTVTPYKGSTDTGVPLHTASFDFPDKFWTAGAQLQIRFGRTEYVARPKP